MDSYEKLKLFLVDERGAICQARAFWPHDCQGGLEAHHALFDRQRARGNKRLREYADNPMNLVLVCHLAHDRLGHSKRFRAWWKQEAARLYGEDSVQAYLDAWPGKVHAVQR